MKKLFSIFIFLLTLCLLVACNTTEELPENTKDSTVQTTELETSETVDDTGEATPNGFGGIERMYVEAKYDVGFYGIEHRFTEIVGQEAYEEWVEQSGYYEGNADLDEYNVLGFIKYFNISKEDFKEANMPPPELESYIAYPATLEDYAVFTDEQIDALYSNDKALLAQYHMNPRAINVDGEIYPPIWFADCSLAEVQAAGITKEVLEEKYEDWVFAFSEQSDICQNTKEILDAWNEEISEETTGTDTTLTE